jgi:hypothetical protein
MQGLGHGTATESSGTKIKTNKKDFKIKKFIRPPEVIDMTKDQVMEVKWRNVLPPELQKKDKKGNQNYIDKNKPDENDKYNFIYDHRSYIY